MAKTKYKGKLGKTVARILGVPLGGLTGYWLAIFAMFLFPEISGNLSTHVRTVILLVSSFFFAVIFFISAPAFAGWLAGIGYAMERAMNKCSQKDFSAGLLGLIAGLFVGFLIGEILKLIPIPALSITLVIIAYVICAVLGMVVGAKKFSEIVVVKDKNADKKPSATLKILDSSAIIDGRIFQISKCGFLEGTLIVPRFILVELQALSDSRDDAKRTRGRRALDAISDYQQNPEHKLMIVDSEINPELETDSRLLKLAENMKAKVVTTDYNLCKVAKVLQISVLNVNDLIQALRPDFLPGETIQIELIKPGKDSTQGVGYLADGTMVVVENGGKRIGKTVTATVTNVVQTNSGKMIFAKISYDA